MSKAIIRKMSEVQLQEVEWLWKPYIPFGKITIIQGDPGEGKTTFALRLAAACSSGEPLCGMEITEPFNVIYQTAEDGLGDTIKPRLIEAGANENMVLNIIEDTDPLSLSDKRIEKAITETNARLMILDPIQGYIDKNVDINRANEIRSVLKKVATVAERTGCAIVLVGHLNKAKGASAQYRGLGSIDFRAAARSVLLVGRLRKDPSIRIVVHDKSSLAPEGKSIAFNLGNNEGFYWVDGYDEVTAEELLCGYSAETKTAVAEELIRDMLDDGEEVMADEIFRVAESKNISRRTVNEAKKKIPNIKTRKVGKGWAWSISE
ncbi:MAG: AAA family ATPase [Clostridia bacterium]|nr:AAA family ATPase [Clostridia bacterium]